MEQPRKDTFDPARWDIDRTRFHPDRPFNRPPAPEREVRGIDTILKDVIAGMEKPCAEEILVLRNAWVKLVGEQVAAHSNPGFIRDFVLYVYVDHPGWKTEFDRIARPLLQKVQSQFRQLRLRRLVFLLEHR